MSSETVSAAASAARSPFARRRRRWWVGLAVFLTLFFIGVSYEFGGMDLGDVHPASLTAARYQAMLECFALLLVYLVPFFVFVRYTRLKSGVPRWFVVLAFFAGWFVPGWLAGDLNDAVSGLIRAAAGKGFANTWGDAIEAPLVEETLKLLTLVLVLGLVHLRGARDWLVGGMCVGMGFQVSEDLGYIESQVAGSRAELANAVPFTLNVRISGALSSHWVYTALVAVAAWLLFCERRRLRGWLYLLIPVLAHFMWDTPLSAMGALPTAVISLLTAFPFLYAWGDIAFDGGRALASPPRRRARSKGEKDDAPSQQHDQTPQAPQGMAAAAPEDR
ncbi:MAG: PrsW family glutamic-type intramembrane protease [Parafannyhessea sp.]|uniref:PrsW family glutamic-type intramembrane protease n=1 Tax=Parafannyhessea sp. TaxID=2847324 RepID=UPI003F0B565F